MRAELIRAMEDARIDSPRGYFKLSRAHNPIQTFYLRKAQGVQNKVISVAANDVEDPARGCKLGQP